MHFSITAMTVTKSPSDNLSQRKQYEFIFCSPVLNLHDRQKYKKTETYMGTKICCKLLPSTA